jgi:hypothetical protein
MFKRRHNIIYRILSGESRSVDSETVRDRKNYHLLKEIEDYDFCDINTADETGLFFSLQLSKTFTFQGCFCYGGIKFKRGYCAPHML